MPLILPRRSLLSYPAGTAPGFDPSHPALGNIPRLVFSAISVPGNYLDLARGNLGTVSGTGLTYGIDGVIGPANNFGSSGATNLVAFGVPPLAAVAPTSVTTACIVRIGSAFTGVNQYTINTIDATGGFGISVNNGDLQELGATTTILSASALALNTPYFLATSLLVGTDTNWVIANLATGQITSGTVADANSPLANTVVQIGNRGTDTARTFSGSIAAGMLTFAAGTKRLSIAQLRDWAKDPWSFWYPPSQRKALYSYSYAPPATATTGGARVLQRFNRSKLAYPAGSLPGFDPSHPVATVCDFSDLSASAVCVNGNLYDILRGIKGTITTGAGAFTPTVHSIIGPALQFGSGTTNTNLVSIPARSSLSLASGVALIGGIFRLPAGAATNQSHIIGNYDANGGPNLVISPSSSFLSYTDSSGNKYDYFDYTPIFGHQIFTAISLLLTGYNWVVCSLQNGRTWSGTVTGIANVVGTSQTSASVFFGNRGGNGSSNIPFAGGSIAAGMFSENPSTQLTISQLRQWAADPWSFWYPNKPLNLMSDGGVIVPPPTFLAAWARRSNPPVLGTGNF